MQEENNQIWLSDIPKGESIEFTSLLPKYKQLLNIQWITFFALLIIALVVAYFNFEKIELVWFGVAFTLWLIFLLAKFSFIQLGFPNKGYAIAGMEYEEYVDVKKVRLKGLTYDQILTYLKNAKKEDRLDKYKALLKFRNIPFEADLFTWHNDDL